MDASAPFALQTTDDGLRSLHRGEFRHAAHRRHSDGHPVDFLSVDNDEHDGDLDGFSTRSSEKASANVLSMGYDFDESGLARPLAEEWYVHDTSHRGRQRYFAGRWCRWNAERRLTEDHTDDPVHVSVVRSSASDLLSSG